MLTAWRGRVALRRVASLVCTTAVCFFYSTGQAADKGLLDPMMRSLSTTAHGYTVIPDITGTAPSQTIERFEVRPGDCGRNSGWNDCEKDRERSELSERRKATGAGTERWYGWYIYFPEDFRNVFPTKVSLGQFHQYRSRVIWMFQNHDGGYHLDNHVSGRGKKYRKLIDDRELRGKWHRVEVHVRWSVRADDGFMKVWINGQQKVDYVGQTMTASVVYFKYGLYRSFVSRYRKRFGGVEVPAQTVYYASVKAGHSRQSIR